MRAIGVLLLIHFVLVAYSKLDANRGPDVFWLSHVSLAMAGVGLVAGRSLLPASALVSVLVLHSVWIVDCILGLGVGFFPVGVSSYVQGADAWAWLGTVHHFYLLPLLFVIQKRHAPPISALILSIAVFASLTAPGRAVLPATCNVNWIRQIEIWRWSPFIQWANGLAGPPYVLVLNGLVFGLVLLPAWVVLRRVMGLSKTTKIR